MNYEAELDKALKKLKDIEFALNESTIVAITDEKGVIQFVNEKFCEISKYEKAELEGRNHNIVNSGYHSQRFFKDMWRTIGTGRVWRGEVKNRAKDGEMYWVDTTIVPFLDEKKKPYQYISIRHDITKRKEYEEKIEKMAFYDPLTSLPNRHLLGRWMNDRLAENEQHFTVLFLDLDRFKYINDHYGHHAGDLIIIETARRLQECCSEKNFISRQGGDEFIIILNGVFERQKIREIVQHISKKLEFPFYLNGETVSVTASIGISSGKAKAQQEDFLETLIIQADTAMYHAKNEGGNTYCFNTKSQNEKMERYYQLEQAIRRSFDPEQFSLVYQPLMDLSNNQIVGVEALLRWRHPQLGNVSPAEFIPLLEEMGQIIPVGNWVLKSVCEQMKIWRSKGIYLKRASVNVSPIQFENRHFVSDLKQILQETEIEPECLELEITEGTILNIQESAGILQELKELGVRIALDDFGTGYSSLSYLKQLSLDTLKIDKSFIHHLDFDREVIVNMIIFLGKNLNFKVLAEGIESSEQLSYLKKNQCHEGQGYFWSQPVDEKTISTFYRELEEEKKILRWAE